ncbi:MAG: branched-chain amino acid ABC transporter permease [Rhodospirillales bacterium]|jgi:branched-chain amino acid transport system permease protein|nr:branched-chain amino acid ABC transporter permease [Rhodospirillales bacterium]MBT4038633.1 branched-chain amino acid ABC transporter permease [Rhodospirillales bacterium]MBT4627607.1 branched-chain amino acid ABC transporter permease [Rhodospirillales bacterium]MBT5350643.1 branched-chain amino acid ABC transporter permease [Rhodospirillales bacterium]MBT5521500.1 branched-chain amino acid ABC transporter permease [Rhodospirillales bacterium]
MNNLELLIVAPVFSMQLLIDGLLVGSIFALAAYGMALVWGVMNIINIAQGEFVILGGYVTFILAGYGIHPVLTIPFAAVALYGVGLLVYRVVIVRIVERDLFISILATFGISILLQQLMNQTFTADVQTVESGFGTWFLFNNMVTVNQVKVLACAIALVVGTVLMMFLKKSRTGQAIRATAQNARAARILGIDTDKVYATTYALNAAICGAAGALVVMTWVIQPFIGLAYTVRSFMIVIIAGLGNVFGVVASGMMLGVSENFAGFLLGAEFQTAFIFSLLVVILVWRSWRLRRKRQVLK